MYVNAEAYAQKDSHSKDLTLGHQGKFVVTGKEVWAVSDLFTTPDPQLFDKGHAMGGVCEGEPGTACVGVHEEEAFHTGFDQGRVQSFDPTGQQRFSCDVVERVSFFDQ